MRALPQAALIGLVQFGHTRKPPRFPSTARLRCVCMEVCCAERCSNLAQACQPQDAQLHLNEAVDALPVCRVNVSPDARMLSPAMILIKPVLLSYR